MAQHIPNKKSPSLNEQQLRMIRLFKTPMSNEDFTKIRRFIVGVLAKNIDNGMVRLEAENDWNAETDEQWDNMK